MWQMPMTLVLYDFSTAQCQTPRDHGVIWDHMRASTAGLPDPALCCDIAMFVCFLSFC